MGKGDAPGSRPGCRWWLWGGLAVVVLCVVATLAPDAPRGIMPGDECDVGPDGGAWFATTDAAWTEMLDAQNARSGPLLGRLVTQGKAFREPAGSTVLVVRTSVGTAYCRVVKGANEGAEGWTQRERLTKR